MNVKYIIESKYYNGDEYADKLDSLEEVAEVLASIAKYDTDATPEHNRIRSEQVAVYTEEA